MAKITCPFCNTLNDAAEKTCVGCGAPLEAPAPQPVVQPPVVQPPVQPAQTTTPYTSTDSQKLQDGAQQVEKLYASAVSAYGTVWSVTSDAIAISIVAFTLGIVSGATGMRFWGVLGAMLAGLIIGYTEQSFWVNVIASPVGALAGIVVGAILWVMGAGPKAMVFIATALACLGGLFRTRLRARPAGCSAFVRPLLGAAGGFFFALLGLAIGLGIHAILK